MTIANLVTTPGIVVMIKMFVVAGWTFMKILVIQETVEIRFLMQSPFIGMIASELNLDGFLESKEYKCFVEVANKYRDDPLLVWNWRKK